MDVNNIAKSFTEYGNSVIDGLKEIFKKNNVAYEVEVTPNGEVSISFKLPEYARFVDKGRRPGKMPPVSAIKSWVSEKGIPIEAAWPIAKHIGKYGIPARPLDKYFTKPLPKLVDEVSVDIVDSIIKKMLSDLRSQADVTVTLRG